MSTAEISNVPNFQCFNAESNNNAIYGRPKRVYFKSQSPVAHIATKAQKGHTMKKFLFIVAVLCQLVAVARE
jgi:hypothetical protein